MPTKPRFKNLDSIRTVAFVSTFLAHAFSTTSAEVLSSGAYRWAVHLRDVYAFGVPIFFVLSGFLISYLMLHEQESVGAFSVVRFYLRRALRIWPLYFLILGFGFILFPLVRSLVEPGSYRESADWLYYVFFLGNFDQLRHAQLPYGVGLGPTWSIAIEEQFYLGWPLLLVLFPRKRFLVPIVAVFGAALVLSPMLHLPSKHTVFAMIYLAAGAAFGYAAYYHEEAIRRVTDVSDIVPLGAAGAMVAAMVLTTRVQAYMLVPLIGLLIGYLVVHQCYTRRFDLRRIPLLEAAGKYTYGLYLYHSICIFVVHAALHRGLGIRDSALLTVAVKPLVSLLLSAVVSYLSYRYFEGYFLGLKRRRFTPLSPEASSRA